MRTLIILKGLVKNDKLRWVKDQGLDNYFLDIDVIRKLYSSPELITPNKDVLGKAFTDAVYKRFIEVVCTRMSKGCLIVADIENESVNVFETLSLIFGYTTFYVLQGIPQDYIRKPDKYKIPYYAPKRKSELEKEVSNFLSLQLSDKLVIKSYQDVVNYWKKVMNTDYVFNLKNSSPVLHVSDLHSNYELFKELPSRKHYDLTVFHGDYIDGVVRGGSKKLIDLIINDKSKSTVWLEGNHELRLRKYLGSILLRSLEKKVMAEILMSYIPEDFLTSTALEFQNIGGTRAKEYLEKLNEKLKMFCLINTESTQYICTHSGIKYKEQLDPKFIGSVIYGNRDMNRYDKCFSTIGVKRNCWSVHAHCKYPDAWEVDRYKNVINLDPIDEYEVIYGERKFNEWNICRIREK